MIGVGNFLIDIGNGFLPYCDNTINRLNTIMVFNVWLNMYVGTIEVKNVYNTAWRVVSMCHDLIVTHTYIICHS